ncbi:DUF2868 domain-containing protein [Oligella urethralis]|uniref:Uncharacterized membrane protein NMB1645 n=1 Tax=Oligella urethralis TaxID=90245 RepID=A0A2X1WM10_9BURK|nr:DUF2868 domain-containing protein [Oligella urethralis]SPY07825.1 Uncharacterized membrane protein NMB1645 [Oligella urethralis]SUA56446.1 Uncharacterized membrane protein NMB1645 [Oligella urethralis]
MTRFNELWQTEAVRLKEQHHGPMDDSAYIHALRAQTLSPEQKVFRRADKLAHASGLSQAISNFKRYAKYAFLLLLLLAVMSGIGLAYAALGSRSSEVNLLSAWIAILGIHLLSLIVWLIFLVLPKRSDKDYPLLGQAWLWLTQKLARGPHTGLIANALLSLTRQQRTTTWLLAAASHLIWLLILTTALVSLFFLLSTRRYSFVWETTILSLATLEQIAHALNWLPSRLGFSLPDVAQLISPGAAGDSGLQAAWSHWLINQVLIYGLFLRLIAFTTSFFIARYRLARTNIDLKASAYAPLLARLEPAAVRLGVDAPAPAAPTATFVKAPRDLSGNGTLLVGIELDPHQPWPLLELSDAEQVIDGGNIESREQRHALLAELGQRISPLAQILFICDAAQTPDRSHLNLIQTIAQFAQRHWVLLINRHQPSRDQSTLWRKTLLDAGMAADAILPDSEAALKLLTNKH